MENNFIRKLMIIVLMYSSPICTTVEDSVATTTYSTPMHHNTDGSRRVSFSDGSTPQSSTVEDSVATTTYRSSDGSSVFFGDGSTSQSSTVEDSVATTTYSTQMYDNTDGTTSFIFFGDGSTPQSSTVYSSSIFGGNFGSSFSYTTVSATTVMYYCQYYMSNPKLCPGYEDMVPLYDFPHVSLQRLMLKAYKAYSIFIIVVVLLGIVGNLSAFTMIVYRGIARKSSLYFCLACIAFLDLIFNITSGLLEFVVPTLSADEFMSELYYEWHPDGEYDDYNMNRLGKPANVGDIVCGVVTFLSSGAAVASVWINVTVHVTKLIGVLSPFGKLSRNINTITVICCVVSVVFGFIVFAPVSADSVLVGEDVAKKLIDPSYADSILEGDDLSYFTRDDSYTTHYCSTLAIGLLGFQVNVYTSRVMLIAYSIVPGALLTILSLTILCVFMRNYREHKRLMSAQTNQSGRKKHKDNFEIAKNRVLILLPLSFMHIACTIPVIVIGMKRTSDFVAEMQEHENELYKTDLTFLNQYLITEFILEHLRDINHGMTFFIQLALSKSFRTDLFGK